MGKYKKGDVVLVTNSFSVLNSINLPLRYAGTIVTLTSDARLTGWYRINKDGWEIRDIAISHLATPQLPQDLLKQLTEVVGNE